MVESLGYAEISVVQLNVLADKTDPDNALAVLDALDHMLPVREVGLAALDIELAADDVREMRLFEHERSLIEHGKREVLDYTVAAHVAEARDFFKDTRVGNRLVGAENDHVGSDTQALQLLDAVLSGL